MEREVGVSTSSDARCATCGEREDPLAPDCCECFVCERCGQRAPFRVEVSTFLAPPGWRLNDVCLCSRCAEHTDVGAFLEQR